MIKKKNPRITSLRLLTRAAHGHARTCKKSIEDCPRCSTNVKWFGGLPPQDLSIILAE